MWSHPPPCAIPPPTIHCHQAAWSIWRISSNMQINVSSPIKSFFMDPIFYTSLDLFTFIPSFSCLAGTRFVLASHLWEPTERGIGGCCLWHHKGPTLQGVAFEKWNKQKMQTMRTVNAECWTCSRSDNKKWVHTGKKDKSLSIQHHW